MLILLQAKRCFCQGKVYKDTCLYLFSSYKTTDYFHIGVVIIVYGKTEINHRYDGTDKKTARPG